MFAAVLIFVCAACAIDLLRMHRQARREVMAGDATGPSWAPLAQRLAFYVVSFAVIYSMGGWLSYLTP